MNKRKITVITTILTLGLSLSGISLSAKASEVSSKINNNPYFEESTTEYFKDENKEYYKGSVYDKYQWDIKRVTNNGASFYLEQGNHNIVVGIIDSGIDTEHPDLMGNLLGGKNLVPAGFCGDETETGDINDIEDRFGHGTKVAGEIAANGKAKGVAPGIGIKCYRISGETQNIDAGILAKAIVTAVDDGVNVINISCSKYLFVDGMYFTNAETKETSMIIEDSEKYKLLMEAIDYADKNNVVVVVSAGNDNFDCSNPDRLTDQINKCWGGGLFVKGKTYLAPACFPNVITVSATKRDDTLASYSNYGQGYITVAAPGGDVDPETGFATIEDSNMVTMKYNHAYILDVGTSFAAPKVSAEAALILCKNRDLTPKEVKEKIMSTCDKVGDEAHYGAGIINVYNALSQQ